MVGYEFIQQVVCFLFQSDDAYIGLFLNEKYFKMYKLIETIHFKQSLCSINGFFFKLHCICFYSSVLQDRVDSKCTSQHAELMHSCKANFFCNTDNSIKSFSYIDVVFISKSRLYNDIYFRLLFCLSIKIALDAFIGSRKKWKKPLYTCLL